MAFEFVRGYVQLASGLGELTRARATEAAQGLLSLPAAGEVSKRALQVGEIADQLLEAARANRENLLALVRGEVESALERADVVHLADFDRARTALASLTREVEELRDSLLAEASRTPLGRALPGVRTPEEAAVDAAAALTPALRESVAEAAEEAAAAARPSSGATAGARKATAKTASTRKTTAKKTTAKKATAKKATAKQAAAKKTGAKKATATRTSAKKTASTSGSTSGSTSTAGASTAKKASAKKSTAKKSSTNKATSTGNGNG